MSNAVAVSTVLDLAALELRHGHGAELGVRHQATGAKNFAQAANLAHEVRGSHSSIEVNVASLDVGHEVIGANDISASLTGGVSLRALSEDGNADSFARAVRQGNHAAQLLVGLTSVNAETEVNFDGLVELRRRAFLDEVHGLDGSVKLVLLDLSEGSFAILGKRHVFLSFRGNGGFSSNPSTYVVMAGRETLPLTVRSNKRDAKITLRGQRAQQRASWKAHKPSSSRGPRCERPWNGRCQQRSPWRPQCR